jgi:glycosyltransferase involved in cell wall biosynthesis
VFFQNSEDRQLFVDRGTVREEQARVLPGSGVDLERFQPAPLPDGPPTFLFIGRLLRDKGIVELVEAARMLRSELPEARVQLLGPLDDGNRTSITQDQLRSWVSEGVVEYLGATGDVRPFVAAATAVVLPSYREGMPRSLLEGAAMARPLIAAEAPGSRDIVEEGVTGLLCQVRDARSLADAMLRLAKMTAEQRMALGEAARRKVQEQFSEERVIEAYLKVLAELSSAKRTG